MSEDVSPQVIVIFVAGLGLLEGWHVGEMYINNLTVVISWRKKLGITVPSTW